jgi:hypothetical protein
MSKNIFDDIDNLAKKQSKFIRVQSGEEIVLRFDASKIEKIPPHETKDGRQIGWRVHYGVVTPDNEEKVLELAPRWAQELNEYLREGYQNIRIKRKGASLDTIYTFRPVQE